MMITTITLEPDTFYDWMGAADAGEIQAVQAEVSRIQSAGLYPDDPHSVLNAAIQAAGLDLARSTLEICATCGHLFDRTYGGVYVDPNDCADLEADAGVTLKGSPYAYNHYCDYDCFEADVRP